jgi:hypothetical protein
VVTELRNARRLCEQNEQECLLFSCNVAVLVITKFPFLCELLLDAKSEEALPYMRRTSNTRTGTK